MSAALENKVPGFMVLKEGAGEKLLEKLNWTPADFADALNIPIEESYKLLSGEKVGVHTARAFICYFKAYFVSEIIDWDAMGMTNPYTDIRKPIVKKDALRKSVSRR